MREAVPDPFYWPEAAGGLNRAEMEPHLYEQRLTEDRDRHRQSIADGDYRSAEQTGLWRQQEGVRRSNLEAYKVAMTCAGSFVAKMTAAGFPGAIPYWDTVRAARIVLPAGPPEGHAWMLLSDTWRWGLAISTSGGLLNLRGKDRRRRYRPYGEAHQVTVDRPWHGGPQLNGEVMVTWSALAELLQATAMRHHVRL